jgi:hypothetical protein
LLFWPLGLAHAGLLILYFALVLAVSVSLVGRSRDLRQFPWLPLVFLTVHAGAGWGFLTELFWGPPRQTVIPDAVAIPMESVPRKAA